MNSAPILLISGPSGGGKSTFIQQLQEQSLERSILKALPEGAPDWPVLEANDMVKGRLSSQSITDDGPGILLHYDIVFIERYNIQGYQDDPALKLLMDSPSLHIVFVKPDHQAVRHQFLERLARHKKNKSAVSLFWSRFFRLPLRRLLSPLTGKPKLSTENIYEDDKWLAACYRKWELFLEEVLSRHANANLIVVEPATTGMSFQIKTSNREDM